MSALPLKADMLGVGINVCFVPKADVRLACPGFPLSAIACPKIHAGAARWPLLLIDIAHLRCSRGGSKIRKFQRVARVLDRMAQVFLPTSNRYRTPHRHWACHNMREGSLTRHSLREL